MLIGFSEINTQLSLYNITLTGVLHLGAHECEELGFYHQMGLANSDIIWIDANQSKVSASRDDLSAVER